MPYVSRKPKTKARQFNRVRTKIQNKNRENCAPKRGCGFNTVGMAQEDDLPVLSHHHRRRRCQNLRGSAGKHSLVSSCHWSVATFKMVCHWSVATFKMVTIATHPESALAMRCGHMVDMHVYRSLSPQQPYFFKRSFQRRLIGRRERTADQTPDYTAPIKHTQTLLLRRTSSLAAAVDAPFPPYRRFYALSPAKDNIWEAEEIS